MEEEKKKTTFLSVFLAYLPLFLLKFWSGELIGHGIKFCIQRVPLDILLMDLATPKTRNTWKNVMIMYSTYSWRTPLPQNNILLTDLNTPKTRNTSKIVKFSYIKLTLQKIIRRLSWTLKCHIWLQVKHYLMIYLQVEESIFIKYQIVLISVERLFSCIISKFG